MIPLFVELCAGTAALSLRLHGGKNARPPVSRMGNKQGYAAAILRCLGLRSGSGAARYLWCEPDDGCRLLLESYRSAEIRRKAAAIIRGWKDEDPRALWERLRAEGPVKSSPVDPREVGRSLVVGAWSFRAGNPDSGYNKSEAEGHPESCKYPRSCSIISADTATLPTIPASILPDARAVDPREVARWCWLGIRSWKSDPQNGYMNRTIPDSPGKKGGDFRYDEDAPAPALSTLPTLPATIAPDARAVDPREVARWIRLVTANRLINVGPDFQNTGQGGSTHGGDAFCTSIPQLLDAMDRVPVDPLPAAIAPDARAVWPPANLPPGSVVYIDPPYLGHLGKEPTTGYGHDLPRADVVDMARRWADAGAWVVISECAPLVELRGWHVVEITGERIGQKRTFSKQKREFLTMSKPPHWRPSVQRDLWATTTERNTT